MKPVTHIRGGRVFEEKLVFSTQVDFGAGLVTIGYATGVKVERLDGTTVQLEPCDTVLVERPRPRRRAKP